MGFEAQPQSVSAYRATAARVVRGASGSSGISTPGAATPGPGTAALLNKRLLRLVDLALQGPCLLCPHPKMGSAGPAVRAAAYPSILSNCGCAISCHHTPHSSRSRTRGPQDNPGRQEGQVWRPPFADEEIEGDDVVKDLVQGYTE